MKSILEQFAYGNINPSEGEIKKGSRYERICISASSKENTLLAALEGDLLDTFNRYTNEMAEAAIMAETDKFIYGYRLGVLMIMEVFQHKADSIFGAEVWL